MKKYMKIVFAVAGILVFLVLLAVIALLWLSGRPAVSRTYYEEVKTQGALEQKYTAMGACEVSFAEYKAENSRYKKYKIWYPKELESSSAVYPVVVMANGTGVPASKYEAIFEHLASWGFVVIGNEDSSSWCGNSSSASLDFLLHKNEDSESIFFQKIDVDNIGIAGHSQGGVGAINGVTLHENGRYYKAIYTASATQYALSLGLEWPYDVSKINIPYLMVAGTEQVDAETIAPLSSLEENFQAISDDTTKVYARRTGAEHGDMLSVADGYMTAWFMYYLQSDIEAGKVFFGEDAEILSNSNWQDIEINPLF